MPTVNQKKNRSGQMIMEAMIAISIIMIGLLGIITLVSRSLGFNNETSARFTAVYLAAEGIEVVKNLIDQNYAAGAAWDTNIGPGGPFPAADDYRVQYDSSGLTALGTNPPLKFSATSSLYSYNSGADSAYRRAIEITKIDNDGDGNGDEMAVIVTVSWVVRGAADSLVLEDHFFDWREVATP